MTKTIDSQAIKAVYRATTTGKVEGAYDGWAARDDRDNAERRVQGTG